MDFFSGTNCSSIDSSISTDMEDITSVISSDEHVTSGKIILSTHENSTTTIDGVASTTVTVLEDTNSSFQRCTSKEGRLTSCIHSVIYDLANCVCTHISLSEYSIIISHGMTSGN